MHHELEALETAVQRLTHDTLVHLVRRPGQLRMVRVSIPESWSTEDFTSQMDQLFIERGMPGVKIVVLPTSGEPRLLSVVT